MHTEEFLRSLALVLCVAAVTTVIFQRLRQPVVLGYIIAGLIIGPHLPIPLVANGDIVHTLSELGVILLMFALGLEFRLKKLVEVGPTAGITAVIQCSVMLWLGFTVGWLFGWTALESLFCGAIIAISSTTIIAKAFDEQRIKGRLRELVVGILIVEDLIAILLMTALTAVASGSGMSANELAFTVGRLAAFLAGTLLVGMLVVPPLIRFVMKLDRPETTIVATVGICFAVSLLALNLGYSVALGAFLAGSLIAESGEGKRIEHLTRPVRDVFAAIFFVSVGMLIDPRMVLTHWAPIVALTAVVIVGKIVSVSFGAFLTGAGTRTAVQSGMSLAQIGEFSFIIAGLGLSLGATGSFLYPIAVTVSALTTLTTPFFIRESGRAASFVDRKLPRSLQTFAALYARWIERLRAPVPKGSRRAERRLVRLLLVDASLLGAVIIGAAVFQGAVEDALESTLALTTSVASIVVIGSAAALGAPLIFGIVRVVRRLGLLLAARVLPHGGDGQVDFSAAPRRALVVVLQLASLILVGAPLVAVTQPFVGGYGAATFAIVLAGLAVLFWRRAADLHGHVRAGAEVIVHALAKRSAEDKADFDVLAQLAPGLGEPVTIELTADSPATGRSLLDLDLRGRTGASVLVVIRGGAGVVPTAVAPLLPGDILALSGSREAIDAARELLLGPP